PQPLTFALMLPFFRNQTGFGGNNGFTDFKRILGFPLANPRTRVALFALSATWLLVALIACRMLVRSKFGRVLTAIRDAEDRVRFCGYDPVGFKLFVWTLSAAICGVAGALYVPQVGIINPSEMLPANSVEIAIWVAVGGRGTLLGPFLGAALVNGDRSWLADAAPGHRTSSLAYAICARRDAEAEAGWCVDGTKSEKPALCTHISVFETLEVAHKTDKRVFATVRAERTPAQDPRIV